MDWDPYLVGGGTRPDAITGLDDPFEAMLGNLFASAPPEIQSGLRVTSGYRSPEVQAGLYEAAVAKYGSPEAARKWVAPPGRSQHNHGSAVDLKYLSPAAQAWVHENASRFGLAFPMAHEPWHIEPAGGRAASMQEPQQVPMQPPQTQYPQQDQNPLAPQLPQLKPVQLDPNQFRMATNPFAPIALPRVG
jgi:hypothetical protein